jgi:hypothetical protein
MNNRLLFNKVIFWTIILSALLIVIIVYSAVISYQVREQRIKATLTAAPAATAEALEFRYQKGMGYLNTGRWLEAQAELEFVFEIDPNYKDVQTRLTEVYAQVAELKLTPTLLPPTPSQPAPAPTAKLILGNELVAAYSFSGNANDETGSGNHGTIFGAVLTEDRLGRANSAYSFDGIDDYIEIPQHSSLNTTQGVSLVAWILVKGLDFFPGIVSKGNVGNYQESYTMYLTPESRLGFLVNRNGTSGGRDEIEAGAKIPLGTWTHVAGVYDGSTLYTYINGVQMGSSFHGGGIFTVSDPILIGKNERQSSNLPTSFFNGSIDEVKIFGRALSPEEVQALFKESTP